MKPFWKEAKVRWPWGGPRGQNQHLLGVTSLNWDTCHCFSVCFNTHVVGWSTKTHLMDGFLIPGEFADWAGDTLTNVWPWQNVWTASSTWWPPSAQGVRLVRVLQEAVSRQSCASADESWTCHLQVISAIPRLPVVPRVLHPPSLQVCFFSQPWTPSSKEPLGLFHLLPPRGRIPSSFCLLGRSPSNRRGASIFCLVFQVRRDLVDLVYETTIRGGCNWRKHKRISRPPYNPMCDFLVWASL